MTIEYNLAKTREINKLILALAEELEPKEFKQIVFASFLGACSALPDTYWDEVMQAKVSDKLGPDMKAAAIGFQDAINTCRTTQLTRRSKLN